MLQGIQEVPKEEIQEAAKKIPPEALVILKQLVEAAEAYQAEAEDEVKMVMPMKNDKGVHRAPIKQIGNTEEPGEMKRALFLWDNEAVKDAFEEIEIEHVSKDVNGAMLVMDEVQWMNEEQKLQWPKLRRQIGSLFFEDQLSCKRPFDPPEAAREHCVYLWDKQTADGFLEKVGVQKLGLNGNALLSASFENNLEEDLQEILREKLGAEAVQFFRDVVMVAENS